MSKSATESMEETFVETLALLIKEGHLNGPLSGLSEYRKGWLEGYSKACTQITGMTVYQLVALANQIVDGSGNSLDLL